MLPFARRAADAQRVGDLALRKLPVIPGHLSVAAAREVAALKGAALLLVELEEQIVGTVDDSVLATAPDETVAAAVMQPPSFCLHPSMSLAQARVLFVRARATMLPVIAGGFVLGALRRADVDRTPPRRNDAGPALARSAKRP